MSEPIPTIPTPTAVPWTPDMMTQDMPGHAPVQSAPAAPQMPPQAQPHLQHQAQPQMHPAPYQPAPIQRPAPAEHAQPYAPQPNPQTRQVQPQTGAYAPAGQPQQFTQPQHAPVLQPVHHRQQSAPPQMAQAAAAPPHMAGQPAYAPPQYAQPGPPPPLPMAMAPQMRNAAAQPEQPLALEKPKSLIANLLKRSPKPEQAEASALPARSESLFNKNFVLGAVTGLIIGAFVLPKAINILGGGTPAQAQTLAQTQAATEPLPAFETAQPISDGDTFIDNAISEDAP